MKKLSEREIEKIFNEAHLRNPYMELSTPYEKDPEKRRLFTDKNIYTVEELDDTYKNTAMNDIKLGYRDSQMGYYDKWYRYCRADNGRAYDLGVKQVLLDECSQITVIEALSR